MTNVVVQATRRIYAPEFRRAVLWLIFLAPCFYLTYGLANWYASTLESVPSIVFDWERTVPFLAWSIIPYWSINLFYALSLFINETPAGVNRVAGRYLTAQAIACLCFVLFPLAATFTRPATDGLPGFMFDALTGFDKPFNQAPSLHIALLMIIWDHLRRRMPLALRLAWHCWCILIGASVLTTYQHHFIDIATGVLLGLFALWVFPAQGRTPIAGFERTRDRTRLKLFVFYSTGAFLLLVAAWFGASEHPGWLILLWPSLALALVGLAYLGCSVAVFQKNSDGRFSLAGRWLLWPYRIGARINAWAWTRKLKPRVEIADGVHLGQFPGAHHARKFKTVIDLTAEFERPFDAGARWLAVPMLDLVRPRETETARAAHLVESVRASGPVLVCCALGFQRSAGVVARWLVDTGRTLDMDGAERLLRAAGRPVHLAVPVQMPIQP